MQMKNKCTIPYHWTRLHSFKYNKTKTLSFLTRFINTMKNGLAQEGGVTFVCLVVMCRA